MIRRREMNIISAHSVKESIDDLVQYLKQQFNTIEPKMLIYYASSMYNPEELSSKMQDAFPGVVVFGCTTAGEIVSGKMLKNSVVAMAFGKDVIDDVIVEVVPNIKENGDMGPAFAKFESYYGTPMQHADHSKYV